MNKEHSGDDIREIPKAGAAASVPWRAHARLPLAAFRRRKAFAEPTDADRPLMASLAIDFDDGAYRFEGVRYDNLSDAVNYELREANASAT
jgi:hypothetical protein